MVTRCDIKVEFRVRSWLTRDWSYRSNASPALTTHTFRLYIYVNLYTFTLHGSEVPIVADFDYNEELLMLLVRKTRV